MSPDCRRRLFISGLMLAAALCIRVPSLLAQDYSVTELGVLHPGWQMLAGGVDNQGHVAGTSENATYDAYRAVRYADGVLTDLGALGGSLSEALGISSNGLIVGDATTTSDPLSYHGFLWDGQMTDLGLLPLGTVSQAWAVNQNRQVVGQALTLVGVAYVFHAFEWQNGQITDISPDATANIVADGINDSGLIVGADSSNGTALLWQGGNIVNLNSLVQPPVNATLQTARAVNAGGQIVGEAFFPGLGVHGYRFTNGQLDHIGPSQTGTQVRSFALNSAGDVVGDFAPGPISYFTAYVWHGGDIVDLNTLIPPTMPIVLTNGMGINDQVAIACSGHRLNDLLTFRTYLLRPALPGDLDCNGTVDFGDINPFVQRLADPAAYTAAFPGCSDANGDINGDGTVNFGDINPFVALLSAD